MIVSSSCVTLNKTKKRDCYATLCNLTVLRKPKHKKGIMNAAHAYHVEAILPALLCSFENFSGFQITRISMSLLFTKM